MYSGHMFQNEGVGAVDKGFLYRECYVRQVLAFVKAL